MYTRWWNFFSVDGKEFEIRRVTRTFKKEYGITPMVYLNRYRISVAKFLLTTTIRTSDEISTLTGFSDTSYFCSVFKKKVPYRPVKGFTKKVKTVEEMQSNEKKYRVLASAAAKENVK